MYCYDSICPLEISSGSIFDSGGMCSSHSDSDGALIEPRHSKRLATVQTIVVRDHFGMAKIPPISCQLDS